MENADEMVTRTCVVCGKKFQEVKHPRGNKRKFCSHECELEHRRNYRNEYFKKRYAEDEDYRNKVRQKYSERICKRRNENKKRVLEELATELSLETDTDKILEILNTNFRIKSELYDKNARTLQVSKESRN